jgi:hypothetical protein
MHERALSPDQVVEKYRSAMPGQAGVVFADLWKDTVMLQGTWEVFSELFGAPEERLALLDDVSSYLFLTIRQSLIHQLYMILARMTDPAFAGRDRSQHNLSLARLVHELREGGDGGFAEQVEPRVKEIQVSCAPIRSLRHKVIAHSDLLVTLGAASPELGVKSAEFVRIMDRLKELVNHIESHYCKSTTLFEKTVAIGAAESLYLNLERARRSRCE